MNPANPGMSFHKLNRAKDPNFWAQDAVTKAGLSFTILDETCGATSGQVSISTMHLAKGPEFRAVVVMACDDAFQLSRASAISPRGCPGSHRYD